MSSSKSASGFTGGVILVFVDAAGVPIYATDLHQYGVGACGFRCPRSRTVNWSTFVPYGLLSRISGIAILHSHAARYGALFKSLHIAHAIAEVCSGALELDACEIAAGAIEVGTDLLQDVVADELQDTIHDMRDSTAEHVHSCWSAGTGGARARRMAGARAVARRPEVSPVPCGGGPAIHVERCTEPWPELSHPATLAARACLR